MKVVHIEGWRAQEDEEEEGTGEIGRGREEEVRAFMCTDMNKSKNFSLQHTVPLAHVPGQALM